MNLASQIRSQQPHRRWASSFSLPDACLAATLADAVRMFKRNDAKHNIDVLKWHAENFLLRGRHSRF